MTIEQIISAAADIACRLAHVAHALDQHAGTTADVRDRGALHRIGRAAHDAALAMRRPR